MGNQGRGSDPSDTDVHTIQGLAHKHHVYCFLLSWDMLPVTHKHRIHGATAFDCIAARRLRLLREHGDAEGRVRDEGGRPRGGGHPLPAAGERASKGYWKNYRLV